MIQVGSRMVFLWMILLAVPVSLQAEGVHVGFMAGGNLCNSIGSAYDWNLPLGIQDEEVWASGTSFKYAVGGFIGLPLFSHVDIQMGAMYSAKTLTYRYYLKEYYSPRYSWCIYNMNKLEFPVLLSVTVARPLELYAGPSYGLLFVEEDHKDDIASGELSINAGVRVFIKNIFMDVRESYGLSDLYKGTGIGYLKLKPAFHSQVVFFSLGYRI